LKGILDSAKVNPWKHFSNDAHNSISLPFSVSLPEFSKVGWQEKEMLE